MTTLHWIKPYKGPFSKKEAMEIVQQLRDVVKPEVNDIYDARIRHRPKSEMYDVYIRTSKGPLCPECNDDGSACVDPFDVHKNR